MAIFYRIGGQAIVSCMFITYSHIIAIGSGKNTIKSFPVFVAINMIAHFNATAAYFLYPSLPHIVFQIAKTNGNKITIRHFLYIIKQICIAMSTRRRMIAMAPNKASAIIYFHDPAFKSPAESRRSAACNISAIRRLFYSINLVNIAVAISFAPNNISILIGFNNPAIIISCSDTIGSTGNDITAIRGLPGTIGPLVSIAIKTFCPCRIRFQPGMSIPFLSSLIHSV